jgi:hypothetical protein
MVTVRGSKERKYEVRSQLYGTSNLVQRLYYGGIYLAGTDWKGPNGESSSTLEITIERADKRADELGIEVSE